MASPGEAVEEEKSDDWSTGSSRQKSHHALEPDRWGQPVPGKTLTRKKERKKSENWEPIKDKYNSNRFHSTILRYWEITRIQKKKKKKKRETVKVLFHQSLNLLNEHCYSLQSSDLDTFTQVREKERKKKEKKEKEQLRDIFVWCFPVGLILPVF